MWSSWCSVIRLGLALLLTFCWPSSSFALAVTDGVDRPGEWIGSRLAETILVLALALIGAGFALERSRRRRAERSLGERLRFETLLSEQVATFSRVSGADVDPAIRRSLRQMADFLLVDWGTLTEYSDDSRQARATHWWAADGVRPTPSAVGFDESPWVVARLRRGELVRFSRIGDLPQDDAALDRRTYRRLGIKSLVAVPLTVEKAVVGALAFSTVGVERVWRDEFVQRLHLLGEVLASTLSRRRADIEGQRLRQNLAHVGRVSTMGQLTASLAHELNQPLTAILSNAQAAQRILDSDPADLVEVREILSDIVDDDKRAGEVIHRVRGFLTKSDRHVATLDIGDLVSQVARLVSSDAIIRNVAIHLELEADLPPVSGDRVQLQQVVLNLLVNGLDAMRESSAAERTIVLKTGRAGPADVVVAVEDSGVGITEADLEQIFHAFYTTKPEGLGMGLAIARAIVQEHGGELDGRRNPRGGAIFSLTLPAIEPER